MRIFESIKMTKLLLLICFGVGFFIAISCNKVDPNAERTDIIKVYADVNEPPIDILYVDVLGGQTTLYVESNVEFQTFWQDKEQESWLEVLSQGPSATYPEYTEITLDVKSRGAQDTYERMLGTLSLVSPENDLGNFLPIYQGAEYRINDDFSWLHYGSANPVVTSGEVAQASWSKVQTNVGWRTTTPNNVFGKVGYVKLGDESGDYAELSTPYVSAIREDTLLMVSFNALAFSDKLGDLDINSLCVNVTGGGVFYDTDLATRTIDLGTYNVGPEGEVLPEDMWKDSKYLFFIYSTEESPITTDTQIQFETQGDGGRANRVFLDNIGVFRLHKYNSSIIEQQGDGGKDNILGSIVDEENN